jgi:hypothetical protein
MIGQINCTHTAGVLEREVGCEVTSICIKPSYAAIALFKKGPVTDPQLGTPAIVIHVPYIFIRSGYTAYV